MVRKAKGVSPKKLRKKHNDHLAHKIMQWKWSKKKKAWIGLNKQMVTNWNPFNNRIQCEWMLTGCARYSVEKLSESEYIARLELADGQWIFTVGASECEAICRGMLQLSGYK